MALPVIVVIAAMACSVEPSVCVDAQTLDAKVFTLKNEVAAVEAIEWNALLGQSHNDTIWLSGACVHVEPCHLLSDDIQAETYFK